MQNAGLIVDAVTFQESYETRDTVLQQKPMRGQMIYSGDKVTLTWTMPKRNTDKTPIKNDVAARICLQEGPGACNQVGTDVMVAPGAAGSYTDALAGTLRLLVLSKDSMLKCASRVWC